MESRHSRTNEFAVSEPIELKRDVFGSIVHDEARGCVVRDTTTAAPWIRIVARWLAHREARLLSGLTDQLSCPQLVDQTRDRIRRSYLPGAPLHQASFDAREYFRDALRQLRLLHACGVAHNDLAKEANWLCMPGNRAGIVDLQIAMAFSRRSDLFRTLAREDLRHLLKHKRHYAPQLLTARQLAILEQPQWTTRLWRRCGKPVYLFITRRILHWPERNSAVERSI